MADTSMDNARAVRNSAKCIRKFISRSGEATSRATLDVQKVVFEFESGEPLVMDLNKLKGFETLPDGVVRAAAAFGVNTSVGNTFGAIKDNPVEARIAADDRWSTLADDGEWAAEREGGMRIGDLVEAVRRAKAAAGMVFDEAAFRKAVEGGTIDRNGVAKNAAVAAELEAIRLEKIQTKLAEAKAKAAAAAGKGLSDF